LEPKPNWSSVKMNATRCPSALIETCWPASWSVVLPSCGLETYVTAPLERSFM